MNYNFCKRCGNYSFRKECGCVEFKVGHYGFPIDDAETVWAADAEFAAEDFAARENSGDYTHERTLSIWNGGSHVGDFLVRGEMTIEYHVTLIAAGSRERS